MAIFTAAGALTGLGAALLSGGTAAAGVAGGLLASNKASKEASRYDLKDTEDFGSQMTDEERRRLEQSLSYARRPVIFGNRRP